MPDDVLYTTAEIMMATGLGRGTITNRAKRLGFDRNGRGYTFEQVKQMTTCTSHRADRQKASKLREMLNNTYADECWPLRIQVMRGVARLEQYDPSKYVRSDET